MKNIYCNLIYGLNFQNHSCHIMFFKIHTRQNSFLAEVGVVGSLVMEEDLAAFLPSVTVSSESVEMVLSKGWRGWVQKMTWGP